MQRNMLTFLFCSTLMVPHVSVASQDELMEKINRLEQQIQELKALKELQKFVVEKEEFCMKAVGREKFCKCIAAGLPREISFEQYVHTIGTPKEKLGYDTMPLEQKRDVDTTIELRDKCVERGFFK